MGLDEVPSCILQGCGVFLGHILIVMDGCKVGIGPDVVAFVYGCVYTEPRFQAVKRVVSVFVVHV
ncbi:hypothetical protein D3C85_1282260 [compost metagenome]